MLASWKKSYDQPRQHIKKQRHYFVNKGPSSQGYGFSSGHVWIWELDCKESWAPKNWCFWTVVLEKTLESPLDCKEIQPVHPKGDQSWVFIGRTDAEGETPVLWPPDAKSWLVWKDPDAGKDWGQEEKGMTEDEMVGWHHWLNGHEFGWTPGVGDGQGGLACYDSWDCKESDTTERLNWTDYNSGLNCGFIMRKKLFYMIHLSLSLLPPDSKCKIWTKPCLMLSQIWDCYLHPSPSPHPSLFHTIHFSLSAFLDHSHQHATYIPYSQKIFPELHRPFTYCLISLLSFRLELLKHLHLLLLLFLSLPLTQLTSVCFQSHHSCEEHQGLHISKHKFTPWT